jgi:hypothetical protein
VGGVDVEAVAWGRLCAHIDALLERFDIRCVKRNSVPPVTVRRAHRVS